MKKTLIVDIDGTLSRVGDRVKCLQTTPPDWDAFYNRCSEDIPEDVIIGMVSSLWLEYEIILCSGRRESCRADTEKWLYEHGCFYDKMLLRKDGDYRHDTLIKPELLAEAGIELDKIAFVLEDRNSMVKKWREIGLKCLQVAEGDF